MKKGNNPKMLPFFPRTKSGSACYSYPPASFHESCKRIGCTEKGGGRRHKGLIYGFTHVYTVVEVKTIRVPDEVHKRLKKRKTHKNQAFYEVIEVLLDKAEPPSKEELFAKTASFLAKRGAVKVAIFGSQIKGEAGPLSDLDVLVEFPESMQVSLLDRAKLQSELSEILGVDVDLLGEKELRSYIADQVKKEAKVIYERR
ncbi:MAG: nucleotidyltransferase domain-containing protein [Thermoproteota archaeon]